MASRGAVSDHRPDEQAALEVGSRGARPEYRGLTRWVSHLGFPLVCGGAITIAALAMQAGTHPYQSLLMGQVFGFGCVIVLEFLVPYHRSWSKSHGDFFVDVGHGAVIAIMSGLVDPVLRGIGAMLAAALAGVVGLGLWPESWPLVAQFFFALVIGELGQYWVHRLQHETDFLWRFHAVHHSAPRLYWLNASRFHALDILLNTAASTVPLAFLGAPIEIFVLTALFAAVHGIWQHANIPIRIGPLNWIFSMAELHRWHHSTWLEESNTNYGQNLSVWDTVFRTRFLPKDREPPEEIGLVDFPGYPMTWWAQVKSPFQWKALQAEAERLRVEGTEPRG